MSLCIGKDLKMAVFFMVYDTEKKEEHNTRIKTKHLYQLWKRKENTRTAPTISTEKKTYFKYTK